ncbi:MAG: GNAT family N-acetyltransferase [Hamadaea sp.]|nr:GNAT family N-acetyltransferase [Hamadaea sp.]NUR49906.1 GNAT family N-acetyltransferase [Hamadaea sp.]
MSLDIALATLADHDDAYAVYRAAMEVDNPRGPVFSRRTFDCFITDPFPGQLAERYLARLDGTAVGMVRIEAPLHENTDLANVDVIVAPEFRRRGFGRDLFAYAADRVRQLGRTKLHCATLYDVEGCPPAPAAPAAFARSLGFAPALPEIARQLEIAEVDEAVLDRMLAEAWERADGYRVAQWLGTPPDDLIDDVAYLDGRLFSDAPTGDLDIEPEKVTADRVREREASLVVRGRKTVHTGLVHEASGKLVAWTTICLDPDLDNGQALQFITLVDPDHRGHRLGTIAKVENLRRARREDPSVARITTWNAASNGYMISINEAMGFRPAWGGMEWQRAL